MQARILHPFCSEKELKLFHACRENDLRRVKILIDQGVHPMSKIYYGYGPPDTPITIAARMFHTEIVFYILDTKIPSTYHYNRATSYVFCDDVLTLTGFKNALFQWLDQTASARADALAIAQATDLFCRPHTREVHLIDGILTRTISAIHTHKHHRSGLSDLCTGIAEIFQCHKSKGIEYLDLIASKIHGGDHDGPGVAPRVSDVVAAVSIEHADWYMACRSRYGVTAPLSDAPMDAAVVYDRLPSVKYLHSLGFPISQRTIEYACAKNPRALEYFLDSKIPISDVAAVLIPYDHAPLLWRAIDAQPAKVQNCTFARFCVHAPGIAKKMIGPTASDDPGSASLTLGIDRGYVPVQSFGFFNHRVQKGDIHPDVADDLLHHIALSRANKVMPGIRVLAESRRQLLHGDIFRELIKAAVGNYSHLLRDEDYGTVLGGNTG